MQESDIRNSAAIEREKQVEQKSEEQPQHAKRRVAEVPKEPTFDFSQVNFSDENVRKSLGRAYRVLLSYRPQTNEREE